MAASAVRRRSCRGLQTLFPQFSAIRRRLETWAPPAPPLAHERRNPPVLLSLSLSPVDHGLADSQLFPACPGQSTAVHITRSAACSRPPRSKLNNASSNGWQSAAAYPCLLILDRSRWQTLTWRAIPASEGRMLASPVPSEKERSRSMPIYVSLVNWTEQGVKNFRDTVRRADDYRGLVEQSGGQVRQLLWTLGEYDLVVVTDFPDDETATTVLLQTVAGGNVRTKTMKAFDADQMSAIIQRTG
jgi:uncharacterized protein with GYD domain